MKHTKLVLLCLGLTAFLVSMIFATDPNLLACGVNFCNAGAGNKCCNDFRFGPLCYSPQTHQCYGGGDTLCGLQDRNCGSACYNPTTHVCLLNTKLCGINQGVCGFESTCYDKTRYDCVDGTFLIQKPTPAAEICGDDYRGVRCYNPTTHFLCSFPSGFNVVCPKGSSCCGIRASGILCYDPNVEFCDIENSPFGQICKLADRTNCRTN